MLPIVEKKCQCRTHTSMCDNLTGLVECHLYMAKTIKVLILILEELRSLWSLLPKTHFPMKRKKPFLRSKNDIISLFYLENRYTSFCIMKFYDLRCPKPFEDRLKSCQ